MTTLFNCSSNPVGLQPPVWERGPSVSVGCEGERSSILILQGAWDSPAATGVCPKSAGAGPSVRGRTNANGTSRILEDFISGWENAEEAGWGPADSSAPVAADVEDLVKEVEFLDTDGHVEKAYLASQRQQRGDYSCMARLCVYLGQEQVDWPTPVDQTPCFLANLDFLLPPPEGHEKAILKTPHGLHAVLYTRDLDEAVRYARRNDRPTGPQNRLSDALVGTPKRGSAHTKQSVRKGRFTNCVDAFLYPDATPIRRRDINEAYVLAENQCAGKLFKVASMRLPPLVKAAWLTSYVPISGNVKDGCEWPPLNLVTRACQDHADVIALIDDLAQWAPGKAYDAHGHLIHTAPADAPPAVASAPLAGALQSAVSGMASSLSVTSASSDRPSSSPGSPASTVSAWTRPLQLSPSSSSSSLSQTKILTHAPAEGQSVPKTASGAGTSSSGESAGSPSRKRSLRAGVGVGLLAALERHLRVLPPAQPSPSAPSSQSQTSSQSSTTVSPPPIRVLKTYAEVEEVWGHLEFFCADSVGAVVGTQAERALAWQCALEALPSGLELVDNVSGKCGTYVAAVLGREPTLLERVTSWLTGKQEVAGDLDTLLARVGCCSNWTVIAYGGQRASVHRLVNSRLDDAARSWWEPCPTQPKVVRDAHFVLWYYRGAEPGCRLHVGVALEATAPLAVQSLAPRLAQAGDPDIKRTRRARTLGTLEVPAFPFAAYALPARLFRTAHHEFIIMNVTRSAHRAACTGATVCETAVAGHARSPPNCVCGQHSPALFNTVFSSNFDGVSGPRPMTVDEATDLRGIHLHGGTTYEGVRTALTCVLAGAAANRRPMDQRQGQEMYATLAVRAVAAEAHTKAVAAALTGGISALVRSSEWVVPHHEHFVALRPATYAVRGKGDFPHLPQDYRFSWERDPVAQGMEAAVCASNFFNDDDWASVPNEAPLPAISENADVSASCLSCGTPLSPERLAKSAFCRACAKRGKCERRVNGLSCGHPLAYGRCALCDSPLTQDVVRNAQMGSVGPVVPAPQAIPSIRIPPITLVKNVDGNKDALPAVPESTFRMQAQGQDIRVVRAPTKKGRALCEPAKRKVKTSAACNGPVCVGPCAPPIPITTRADRDTNLATVNGRLCPYMPDPDPATWADFEVWVDANYGIIFGGPRPFRAAFKMPRFGTWQHKQLCCQWARSFKPSSKARKKLNGVDSLFQHGGVPQKSQVLKGMPKKELLQSASKCSTRPSPLPAYKPTSEAVLTGQSGLACQRMLRYYDDAVMDALFGPDCAIAYKALAKCWSGEHFIRLGASRKNEDVAQFFEYLDNPAIVDAISSDFTLMDNSHGPHMHALFFRILKRAGFFRTRQHLDAWVALFPQTVTWPSMGTFAINKGMASGAVWTTILNTLCNGLTSAYTYHKAWSAAKGLKDWHLSLQRFLDDTRYRGIHAGDDGVVLGRDLRQHSAACVTTMGQLGYRVKIEFGTTFLGCDPIPCLRRRGCEWVRAWCMVPVPHRFLVTLGWSIDTPSHPQRHVAGVGLGWLNSLSHLPGYGPLVAAMAAANSSQVCFRDGRTALVSASAEDLKTSERLFQGWAEYSAAPTSGAEWACSASTLPALARAWRVDVQTVADFDRDMRSLPSFPVYIGTPATHRIIASSVG